MTDADARARMSGPHPLDSAAVPGYPWSDVRDGNGTGPAPDLVLLRAVESSVFSAPPSVVEAYDRDELVNSVFLILKSRGVRRPTRLQVRSAAIDHHRMVTHYPRIWRHRHHQRRHPSVAAVPDLPERAESDKSSVRLEITEALRDVRRRFGTDGLAVFLLSRVMELSPRIIGEIMDYESDSTLARSLGEIGEAK
jgi:hypothetical protein